MDSAMQAAGFRGANMNRQQRVMLLCGLMVIGATMLLGCAGNTRADGLDERADARNDRVDERDELDSRRAPPAYTDELAQARASLTEAEQAGAAQYGNAELALARDKLRAAERAAEDGDLERASHLAVEADLDADLAAAKTRNAETQELVTEVRAGLRTLEDELRRNAQNDVSRP
jgi:hypothetical protein